MDEDDIDLTAYPLRVWNGHAWTHFRAADFVDAQDFMHACWFSCSVQIFADGNWKVLCQDGDMLSKRAGFFYTVRHKGENVR